MSITLTLTVEHSESTMGDLTFVPVRGRKGKQPTPITVETLNKGHLGTQGAVPYSEVVPYWEVCTVLLQHHRCTWCIEIMLWCYEMKHYGVME